MSHAAALPFTLNRSESIVGEEIVSTTERVHGLLRLESERLVVQWRSSRTTQRVGRTIRVDKELESVREVAIPLSALAGARVRWIWWRWPPTRYLVLTGADLRAFEEIAGESGLRLEHPAELVLRVRRSDAVAAAEFAGELELAVAERELRAAEAAPRLDPAAPGLLPPLGSTEPPIP